MPSVERVAGAQDGAFPHHGLRERHEGAAAALLREIHGLQAQLRGRRDDAGGDIEGRRLRQPHPPREGPALRHRLAPQRPLTRRQQTQGIARQSIRHARYSRCLKGVEWSIYGIDSCDSTLSI